MDQQHLVMTVVCADRPGLVAEVTGFVSGLGGNIEESRMAILGAEFGVMMLVSGSASQLEKLVVATKELEARLGASVHTRVTRSAEEHRRGATLPALVTAESFDREGLVRAVAAAIHALDINIVSLESSTFALPFSGSQMFRVEARIDVPRALPLSRVRSSLEEMARTEGLEIDVKSLASVPFKGRD